MRYYRKIIRIRAEDSPNVVLAEKQMANGMTPTGTVVVPGVLTWDEYCKRRKMWDARRQCVALDADFYRGSEIMLFPKEWLDRAFLLAVDRPKTVKSTRIWMGIDPAEGGDKSTWALADVLGLIDLVSIKTPDTTAVVNLTVNLIKQHGIDPTDVCIDAGGGGVQHAHRLRELGYPIRTVRFGESLVPDPKLHRRRIKEQIEIKEDKYGYFNRRAQMYGDLSVLCDPAEDGSAVGLKDHRGFAIPRGGRDGAFDELRRQLSKIPKMWDAEGRMKLLPKNNPNDPDDPRTLVKLIGHSPDEADAVVLCVHARLHKPRAMTVGGGF